MLAYAALETVDLWGTISIVQEVDMGVISVDLTIVGSLYDVKVALRGSLQARSAFEQGLDWYEVLADPNDASAATVVTKWESIETYQRFKQRVGDLIPSTLEGTSARIQSISEPEVFTYVTQLRRRRGNFLIRLLKLLFSPFWRK